ncbi:hypothetical protein ABPG77_008648 [Micractinium sp. CCAP 211/92]
MQKCLLSSSVFSLSAPPLPSSPSASPACTLLLQPPIYARKTTVACRVALDTVCSKEGSGSGEGARRPARRPPFEQRCRQLEAYIQQHGHSRVPVSEPSGLGRWAAQQRHAWKTGRLLAARQQRLTALGFWPDAFEDAWLARFRQLAAFHSAHGHCRVPGSGPASRQHPGLHAWLHHQLHLWRQGMLADGRRRRLEGLGVEWGWYEAAWDARFQELLEFRQEFGHAMVPASWPASPGLARWVQVQRRRWRGSQGSPLTPAQESRLLSCGFQFAPLHDGWERRYTQLCELRLQHTSDSLDAPLPQQLSTWLAHQRRLWRLGRLAPDRAARLGALGIQPSRSQKSWQQRIASLDRLVDALGFPAAYALLLLTPASSAPRMAAQAVSCVASSGGGASRGIGLASEGGGSADMSEPRAPVLGGPQRPSGAGLTAREAAEVVQWHRRLRAGAMPAALAQALAARGLQALR